MIDGGRNRPTHPELRDETQNPTMSPGRTDNSTFAPPKLSDDPSSTRPARTFAQRPRFNGGDKS